VQIINAKNILMFIDFNAFFILTVLNYLFHLLMRNN
jgi:hypothetical protein